VHVCAVYFLLALLAAPARADNSGAALLDHRPALTPAPVWRAPVPIALTTQNGIRVVVAPANELPLVSIVVLIAAGSDIDPPDRPGLAAATALLVQQGGAGPMNGQQVAEALDALGGELKVECDRLGVRLQLTVQSSALGRALDLLGQMITEASLERAEWARARSRRVAEILRARDDPRKIADQVFDRAIYSSGDAAHPYAHPPLGTRQAIESLSVEEVRAFYHAHWGPRATQVVLVGDVAPAQEPAVVERAFARWRHDQVVPPPVPAAPRAPTKRRVILVDRPGAPQSAVRVGHLGVSAATADFPSLSVLEMVLGGSFTSRLTQNLREKHGYTYGINAKFELWRAPGPFVIRTAVRTDATAPALGEILAELARIRAPLQLDELSKGRALVEDGIVEAMLHRSDAALLFALLAATDRPLALWNKLPEALAALRPQAVASAAKRLFLPDAATVVIVGDRAQIEKSLAALPLGAPIEHQDVDGNPVAK
jgi:zinc protease